MAFRGNWVDLRQLILPFYNKGKEKLIYLFMFPSIIER